MRDGAITVGNNQQEIDAQSESRLGAMMRDGLSTVESLVSNPLVGGLLYLNPVTASIGSLALAYSAGKKIVTFIDALGKNKTSKRIEEMLEDFDHPVASLFTEQSETKKLAQMASGIALGTKAKDLSIRRAFPTFKIFFIEDDEQETEQVDGAVMRAFDDFYSYSAIQEIRILRTRKVAADMAVIRMTNVGGKLLRRRFGERDPALIEEEVRKGIGAEDATGIFADTDREDPFGRMILQDGVKVQIRLGYCVDKKTEILTKRGWLKYNEVTTDDYTLTLNHKTGFSEWKKVKKVNLFEVENQEMMFLNKRYHSSLTTLNHRWPVLSRKRSYKKGNIWKYKHTREWKTSATLKSYDKIIGNTTCSDLPTIKTWDDSFVEAVAWFWTEGQITNKGENRNSNIVISQSNTKNKKNIENIRRCLTKLFGSSVDSLGIGSRRKGALFHPLWRENNRQGRTETEFRLNSDASIEFLKIAPNKIVSSDFIFSLTKDQLDLFIKISNKGDGNNSRKDDLPIIICQKNSDALDAIELAAILAGYRTTRGLRQQLSKDRNNNKYQMSYLCICKNPNIGLESLNEQTTTEIYNGIIWCPTTDNSTWMARRNGKIFFTGNSSNPDHLESVFLGSIVEIAPTEGGKLLEITCQGFGAELEGVELGALEDGPVFYSSQQVLSGAIIQDSVVNFGRRSDYNRFTPGEARHSFTGGRARGAWDHLSPQGLLDTWGRQQLYRHFYRYSFRNFPQDDNIFAPPPDAYTNNWETFYNNACTFRPLKQTPWQIFQEHELRHPGYISLAVPYGHTARMTMFFGAKGQHYWSKPPSALELFLSENAADAVVRMRGFSQSQITSPEFIQTLAKLKEEYPRFGDAIIKGITSFGSPTGPSVEIAKIFGRYIPFRNYHYLDSSHHILKNSIRTSIEGTYNEVEVLYFDDENDIEEDEAKELTDNLSALSIGGKGVFASKLDENIPEEYIRSYRQEFPSCITEFMARRYAQGLFARLLRDSYKGELYIIGEPTLKPYDICVSGDTLIDTICGPKQIKDIEVGDEVLTHNCRFRKVKQTFSRKPIEKVYSVKCKTSIDKNDLVITGNHPVFALKREKILYGNQTQRIKMWDNIQPEFVPVHDLKPKDYLVIPRVTEGESLKKEFGMLLGYYLAEGSIIWEYRKSDKHGRKGNNSKEYSKLPKNIKVPVAIKWSFNLCEELHVYNEINLWLKKLKYNTAKMYKNESRNGLSIICYDRNLVDLVIKHVGFSDNKSHKSNKWLRRKYDFDTTVNILGKYLGGDGYQDKKYREGSYTATSTSYNLIRSIYRALIDIGIPCPIQAGIIKSGWSAGNPYYTIRIQKKFSQLFSSYAKRFDSFKDSKSSNTSKFIKGKYCYIPVESINIKENYNDYVYNIEVEEDNSYVANNKIVHNCYINDASINMVGPIEVEAVEHIINRDHGFISIITPDLCVDVNEMYSISVFDVVGSALAATFGYLDIGASAIGGAAAVGALTGGALAGPIALSAIASPLGLLALSAGVKFMMWMQEGSPVIATPLTLEGKPFMSATLGQKRTSLFLCQYGKWVQYWDDLQVAWDKFDIGEEIFDSHLSVREKMLGLFTADPGASIPEF